MQAKVSRRPKYLQQSLFCLALALSGCGGGGGGGDGGVDGGGSDGGGDTPAKSAPVLSSFTFTPTEAAAGLQVTVNGEISFSDPDGDLGGGSFNYSYEGITYSFPIDVALNGVTEGIVAFMVEAQLSASTGPREISGWLVDGTGRQSNQVTATFTQLWTRQFGTAVADIGYGIDIGTANTVVVAGTTAGDLGGQTNQGLTDVFVTRYSQASAGEIWTRLLGSTNSDTAHDISNSAADGIYIVGDTLGIEFEGQVADGSLSGFLSKINDDDGARLWTVLLNTDEASDTVQAVDTSLGTVAVAGSTTGNLHAELNSGSWDAFVAKYDSEGNRIWTRLLGSSGSDHGVAVAVDMDGNIYLAGHTEGVLGTDPSPGDPLVNFDAFIAKYSASGDLLWVSQLGTSCSELATDIDIVASGDIFIAGRTGVACAFPGNEFSGLWDAFVARVDAAGNLVWLHQFGTASNDSAEGIAAGAGGLFVTGYLDSVYLPIDPLAGNRIFLAMYSPHEGPRQWLVEPPNVGYSWGNRAHAVVVDCCNDLIENIGQVFLTGAVRGAIDLHTNPGFSEPDVFILNYDGGGDRH